MKKVIYLIIPLILLICINACSGYKPIFSSSNLQFEIVDYVIEGDKKLGNQIYSKLYNLSNSNKNNPEAQSVHILIEVLKDKTATVKDSAGKILEYRISLNSNIVVKNYLTKDEILTQNSISFSSYKVQNEYSETVKLENKIIENLVNKTYQDLLIKLSENITPE
tara:strand:+ start:402 stop:896 length:495 start_codon:yes stop_codon:yes gene_type:complete